PVVEELLRRRLALEAPHMRALPGAPQIPADDVEPSLQLGVEVLTLRPHLLERSARTAGVPEQGADPPIGIARQMADHCKRDGVTARMTPIVCALHMGALQALAATGPDDTRLAGFLRRKGSLREAARIAARDRHRHQERGEQRDHER